MKANFEYWGSVLERYMTKRYYDSSQKNSSFGQAAMEKPNEPAYKVTISDESIELQLQTRNIGELLADGINNAKAEGVDIDPSNLFSYLPSDQWLVFTQYLHESHYFDSLSTEEMEEIESTLQYITDGLDLVNAHSMSNDYQSFGYVVSKHGGREPLTSYEGLLELGSSTAALQAFSEKFLNGDIKQGFDELITKYVDYNTPIVRTYKSFRERFEIDRARVRQELRSETLSPHLSMISKLSRTNYSEKEIRFHINSYLEMFKEVASKEDLSSVLSNVKEQLLQFVTKGISPKDADYYLARNYITHQTKQTFNHIEKYWTMLLADK
ncbi:MAG TPA: hypothetical protein GX497_04765 [Bacillus bacterium]|nr:hypothetical protein [Bacillus sp. (in: firmicutes)]